MIKIVITGSTFKACLVIRAGFECIGRILLRANKTYEEATNFVSAIL